MLLIQSNQTNNLSRVKTEKCFDKHNTPIQIDFFEILEKRERLKSIKKRAAINEQKHNRLTLGELFSNDLQRLRSVVASCGLGITSLGGGVVERRRVEGKTMGEGRDVGTARREGAPKLSR